MIDLLIVNIFFSLILIAVLIAGHFSQKKAIYWLQRRIEETDLSTQKLKENIKDAQDALKILSRKVHLMPDSEDLYYLCDHKYFPTIQQLSNHSLSQLDIMAIPDCHNDKLEIKERTKAFILENDQEIKAIIQKAECPVCGYVKRLITKEQKKTKGKKQ